MLDFLIYLFLDPSGCLVENFDPLIRERVRIIEPLVSKVNPIEIKKIQMFCLVLTIADYTALYIQCAISCIFKETKNIALMTLTIFIFIFEVL